VAHACWVATKRCPDRCGAALVQRANRREVCSALLGSTRQEEPSVDIRAQGKSCTRTQNVVENKPPIVGTSEGGGLSYIGHG